MKVRLAEAALIAACLVLGVSAAQAGWLSRLVRGPEGAHVAAETIGGSAAAFDAAGRLVRGLPAAEAARALAVAATQEGHWRLANAAGEQFTAASPDELSRGFDNLLAKAVGSPALYLTEHTAFTARGRLRELPKEAMLAVVVAGKAYPVRRIGAAGTERLFALAAPRLAVELIERPAFDEILWQLARPLAAARVRQIALEPGGPASLAVSPRLEAQSGKAEVDRLSPGALASELGSIRGQTAMLSGRIEADRLVFQPARGADGAVSLTELMQAARLRDVALIVLDANSPRQPVGRNWLWLKVEVKGLEPALGLATAGDFLSSLASGGDTLAVTGALDGSHLRLTARPLQALETGGGGGGSGGVGGVLSEWRTRFTGNVTVNGVEALLLTADRRAELDFRLLAGIPSDVQLAYLALLAAGLAGAGVSWRWWAALWPAERREEYAGLPGLLAARLVRALVYVALFMPLAALPALLAAAAGLLRRGKAPVR